MIIILVAISLIYVILLIMILKAYYRDNSDLYDRILVLEKRLESYRKEIKKDKEEGDCMGCRKGEGGRKK